MSDTRVGRIREKRVRERGARGGAREGASEAAREGAAEAVEVRARRAETALACELGRVVHHRRTELGLSQTALARRADMTQPQISTIEGGGTVPTLPILVRLARALEASLHLAIDDDAGSVTLVPRAAV